MRRRTAILGLILLVACEPDSPAAAPRQDPAAAARGVAPASDPAQQPVVSDEFRSAERRATTLEYSPTIDKLLDLELNFDPSFRIELPKRTAFRASFEHVEGELGTLTFRRWEPGGRNPREDRIAGAEPNWSWTASFESSDRTGPHVFSISTSEPMKIQFSLEADVAEARQ